MYMDVYEYTCIYIYICIWIFMYIYICIYVDAHIDVYVYKVEGECVYWQILDSKLAMCSAHTFHYF